MLCGLMCSPNEHKIQNVSSTTSGPVMCLVLRSAPSAVRLVVQRKCSWWNQAKNKKRRQGLGRNLCSKMEWLCFCGILWQCNQLIFITKLCFKWFVACSETVPNGEGGPGDCGGNKRRMSLPRWSNQTCHVTVYDEWECHCFLYEDW